MDYKKRFGRVLLLTGGWGSEREVSLMSAEEIAGAMAALGIDYEFVDAKTQHGVYQQIIDARADRVFIVMHGSDGESGFLQALLEGLNLPYTGSGVAANALTLDKMRCKWLWQGLGLATPKAQVLTDNSDWQQVIQQLGLPLFVKPGRDGSSIGISKVTQADQLVTAYQQAKHYDDFVFAERFMSGGEYTVGILNQQALPSIRIETPRAFYDYQAKYFVDDTQYFCPAGLTEYEEAALGKLALQAFHACGCQGWGRVDLMRDEHGEFNLIEVNTIPGMTSHSLVPKAASVAGLTFSQLIVEVLEQTLS